MATSQRALDAPIREKYLRILTETFTAQGEEVLRVGNGEIALPCVDSEGNEKFVVFIVKIPTGSREGDPYDGYSMAEDFEIKQRQNAEKEQEEAKRKAKKIARDEKARAKQAELKAKREARKTD